VTYAVIALMALTTGVNGCSSSDRHAGTAAGRSQQLTPQQMTAYDDTVRVDTQTTCGTHLSGAGLTDGHYVLASAHEVAGASAVTVTNRAGRQVGARVISFDADLDVAWLYAPGLPSRPTRPAAPTDTVAPAWVFTFPGGGTVTIYRSAQVTRTRGAGPDVYRHHDVTRDIYTLTLDRPVGPGADGAPVLDHDGNLLGIVFETSPADAKTVTAIAGDAIAASRATVALRSVAADPASARTVSSACR
jgi:S1-C subfamily serine protease